MNRGSLLITFLTSLLLPVMVYSASVYETQADFLSRAFNDSPPEPTIVWLSGERKSAVRQILGHDYAALRLRYWCEGERSAWILEEIGKDLPITVGINFRCNPVSAGTDPIGDHGIVPEHSEQL